ncbi:cyclic nucleotide-binding domain-containing protein [Marinoscillum sp. MHG1-6]|uniref:cyclic nucleotide-binding domain-containing protein n=1 Tax=Marinoscillum sp. MHG1-6 TaxID=2959627 RepID=UPI0021585A7E|nr:cyclic nucleotide-binding domain-containing protein [Marinoscillum sp. MHG1-6]
MLSLPKPELLGPIYDEAHEITLNEGDVLSEQFAKADYFYFLLEGKVSFFLKVEEGTEELMVGQTEEPLTPIGWSALTSPNRYATTAIVSSENARLLCWEFSVLEEKLLDDSVSISLINLICSRCTFLIREATELLSTMASGIYGDQINAAVEQYQSTKLPEEEDIVQFLRQSPFFEIFEEDQLEFLARHLERRQYRTNDVIYEQGTETDGIYILVSGKVTFSYRDQNGGVIGFRNLVTPGFMVGWSASIGAKTLVSATAKQETVLYVIPIESLNWFAKKDLKFSREFHYRLLWLIGHQLQAIRARLISAKFNHEIIAISNLIEQNSTNLKLTSELHKVPHLLQNKLTIENGIQILENLKRKGDPQEKNIAALCLDTVVEVTRELNFYNGLVNVYQEVTNSPDDWTHSEVRKHCAYAFSEVFSNAKTVIEGWENLPDEPGHIFIYNHLRNHPFNTLPNNFQITLDSHFISSEILMKKYGDPGIRIVRIGRGGEYGHQDYYNRLGHIDVFTNESDPKMNTKEHREKKRQEFYEVAGAYLKQNVNLLISPEGTSFGTEESPGPFKAGAFRLALNTRPEPLIIPISIANFDKRVRKNTFSVIINPPFRVSEYISKAGDKNEMKLFLTKLREKFREYVELTADQANEPISIPRYGRKSN